MDWKSEHGKACLRKVFPEGYLPRRGVFTVGGWTCVREPDDDLDVVLFCKGDRVLGLGTMHRDPDLIDAEEAGDLLPLPDASDTSTWACLKVELARLLGAPANCREITWSRWSWPVDSESSEEAQESQGLLSKIWGTAKVAPLVYEEGWGLSVRIARRESQLFRFLSDLDDSAEVLVDSISVVREASSG